MTEDQFRFVVEHLSRQTQLLEVIAVALADDEPEVLDGECQHPDEKRVSLATPRMPDHWICSECKHEHRGVITN